MDPQLEFFLEDAFKSVARTSPHIGRVVVEPDYDTSPVPQDREQLTRELIDCIQERAPDTNALACPQGWSIEIEKKHTLLAKYVRKITMHEAPAEHPWIEVAPPGNWI